MQINDQKLTDVTFRDYTILLILSDIKDWLYDFVTRVSKNEWFDGFDCVTSSVY